MITFEKFTLENGLTVLFHQDKSTPLVAVNTLYKVGARDENPNKTGFAHLFEHLMFGGSKHIPDFDTPLQAVGGENNAFTNNENWQKMWESPEPKKGFRHRPPCNPTSTSSARSNSI